MFQKEQVWVLKHADIPRAWVLLIGQIYALNLSYVKELKNTFEVFKKIFLELECLKASPKVKPTVVQSWNQVQEEMFFVWTYFFFEVFWSGPILNIGFVLNNVNIKVELLCVIYFN